MYQFALAARGGNGRGAMPFLMSFALEHEIVTFACIDNASVQFPLNMRALGRKRRVWVTWSLVHRSPFLLWFHSSQESSPPARRGWSCSAQPASGSGRGYGSDSK